MRTYALLALLAACDSPPPVGILPDSEQELREPTLLAGSRVELWLDAAHAPSFTTPDGALPRWADRSPHRRDATQSVTGAQPIYASAGLAGLPAVTFDGIDDQLVTPGFITDQNYATFIVAANHDAALPIADHVSSVLSTQGCVADTPGLTLFTYSSTTTPNTARLPGVVTGTAMGLHVRVNIQGGGVQESVLTQTGGVEVSKDAWFVASLQTLGSGHGGPGVSLGAFRDGCHHGHVSIAEIIVLSSGATFADLHDIENYLARKWRVEI